MINLTNVCTYPFSELCFFLALCFSISLYGLFFGVIKFDGDTDADNGDDNGYDYIFYLDFSIAANNDIIILILIL